MAESTGILLLNAEDNDLTHLVITEEGDNTISITEDSALHGTLGYELGFAGVDNQNYFYEGFTPGSDISVRVYFRIPTAFSMNASFLSVATLAYGTSGVDNLLIPRIYNPGDGNLYIQRLYYYVNAGQTYANLSQAISRDDQHYMEMRFKSGDGDGIVQLLFDGVSIFLAENLNTDNQQAGYIYGGNLQAGVPTDGSKIHLDDYKVDSLPIGAYADVGGVVYPKICISEEWKDVTNVYTCVSEVWKESSEIQIAVSESWKDLA